VVLALNQVVDAGVDVAVELAVVFRGAELLQSAVQFAGVVDDDPHDARIWPLAGGQELPGYVYGPV
jgi:hypothetical protein